MHFYPSSLDKPVQFIKEPKTNRKPTQSGLAGNPITTTLNIVACKWIYYMDPFSSIAYNKKFRKRFLAQSANKWIDYFVF